MKFDPGFKIEPVFNPMGFQYGEGVFGPEVEIRKLNDIRKSLLNPDCNGPEEVYAIAMDVGKMVHKQMMIDRHLLFGVVTYAPGQLGEEPVRSQGHIHKKARNNTMSPPEIYEIWTGKAIIYMQEFAEDDPGRCFAVEAGPGEVVIVPPNWVHATISADPQEPLTFGAWCDRDYDFDYTGVRSHNGLAWFPVFNNRNELEWIRNHSYLESALIQKKPGNYAHFGINWNVPIYTAFEKDPDAFLFVPNPESAKENWRDFIP
ncbi:MAG: glucose-6-phosphate isomerase [Bacteroidales bacterium]|nr:glucose-6-phosphate isomerase [Bacteroidales bacterium]